MKLADRAWSGCHQRKLMTPATASLRQRYRMTLPMLFLLQWLRYGSPLGAGRGRTTGGTGNPWLGPPGVPPARPSAGSPGSAPPNQHLSLHQVSGTLPHGIFPFPTIPSSLIALPPLEHPQRAKGIPPAGRTETFQLEVGLALVAVLQRPATVLALGAKEDADRFGKALVAGRAYGLEVIEGAEDIVVPPRREREAQEDGFDDLASAMGTKQPVHQQELAAAALRSPHRLHPAPTVQLVQPQRSEEHTSELQSPTN